MKLQCVSRLSSFMFLFVCTQVFSAHGEARLSEEVIASVRSGVVQVIATSKIISRRSATGFRWTKPDLVVTSYHVVAGADSILVQSTSGGLDATLAELVAVDIDSDIALLRMNRTLPGIPLSHRSTLPEAGTQLWVVGYPLEVTGLRSRRLAMSDIAPDQLANALDSAARNDLVALGFPTLEQKVVQLEGDLLPGDSGAPVLDSNGVVVAIGNGGLKRGQVGLGWGIPAAQLDTLSQKTLLNNNSVNLVTLQKIHTSFFSRISTERLDETLWATASQLNSYEAYQDYIERFPNGAFMRDAQTRLDDLKKRYNIAFDYFRRAMEYQAQLGIGGDIETVLETHDRTENNLKRSIAVYPRFVAAHIEIGHSKYLMAGLLDDEAEIQKAYKAAIDDFNNAIDLSPESPEAYLYRGFAYAKISDYRYACEDYISFQRLKYNLSPSKFEHFRQQLRFSRNFLDYHGCDVPTDLEFVDAEDLRGNDDQNNVEKDCRPQWWVGEAEYCAERGHVESMEHLASEIEVLTSSLKHLSIEDTQKLEMSVHYANILADMGNPIGQYYLGYMYWNGVGKPYVPELAFAYIKSSAEAGYPNAFGTLGSMYMDGLVELPNPETARKTWARGAVKQDSYSISSLNRFEQSSSLFEQRLHMFEDFKSLLERGSCIGYVFKYRGNMAERFEAACKSRGPHALEYYAIEGLAENKSLASKGIPILMQAYKRVDDHNKERIVYALKNLRELTPEAITLLKNITLSEKSEEAPERINLDDSSRRRSTALEALGAAGVNSRPIAEALLSLLKSADRHVRLIALGVIGEIGDPSLVRFILPLANDPSNMVQLEANRYIEKFNGMGK